MSAGTLDRKTFVASLGCACMCAAASSMRTALAAEPSPAPPSPGAKPPETRPGDKTPERAAKRMEFVDGWVGRFFAALDQALDEPTRRRLMAANGRACYRAFAGEARPRPEPASLERVREWVARDGKARGYSMDGDVVSFEFVGSAETGEAAPDGVCLCPTVEAQAAGAISPTYCHCSVGYVQEMHERVFGRPVQVELLDSVLRGGRRCRFHITLA